MKRPRSTARSSSTPSQEKLVALAREFDLSSSRLEDQFWEKQLVQQIDTLVSRGDEKALNGALDLLFEKAGRGAEVLADLIEARCQSLSDEGSDTLLIAVPILAWSRFAIPDTPLSAETLHNLSVQLGAHILAANTRLALCNLLLSPDQLPPGFCDIAQFTEALNRAAKQGQHGQLDPASLPETMTFLSDTRYLLGVVATPRGAPLFRWQEDDGQRETALAAWTAQGGAVLRSLFPGCVIAPLPPAAFFSACREADRQSRAFALKASVAFLSTALDLPPDQLQAVIAPFHEQELEEYRLGFTRTGSQQVLHGMVWPLLDQEDESTDIPAQIRGLLEESGVRQILQLTQRFPVEFCDDCGVPLYPSPEGEAVHAEMPEEVTASAPRHLH